MIHHPLLLSCCRHAFHSQQKETHSVPSMRVMQERWVGKVSCGAGGWGEVQCVWLAVNIIGVVV